MTDVGTQAAFDLLTLEPVPVSLKQVDDSARLTSPHKRHKRRKRGEVSAVLLQRDRNN